MNRLLKIFWIFIAVSLFFSACKNNTNINPKFKDSVIIDVRTEYEYKKGHIEGSINIPHTEIEKKIKKRVKNLDKNIIVYCRSGNRSSIAKRTLDNLGYTNVLDAGSYEEMKRFIEE